MNVKGILGILLRFFTLSWTHFNDQWFLKTAFQYLFTIPWCFVTEKYAPQEQYTMVCHAMPQKEKARSMVFQPANLLAQMPMVAPIYPPPILWTPQVTQFVLDLVVVAVQIYTII